MDIFPNSLFRTDDAVNEAFFFGRSVSARQRDEAARSIALRQGLPGCYADMFAPTPAELKDGIVLLPVNE